MIGAMLGTHSTSFSNQTYAVAVSQGLLALQALDKKLQPSKPLAWLRPSDITSATIWGEGGGLHKWLATNSEFQLRFTTTGGDKYKIMALGGWSMAKMMGQEYIDGLEAVGAWLDGLAAERPGPPRTRCDHRAPAAPPHGGNGAAGNGQRVTMMRSGLLVEPLIDAVPEYWLRTMCTPTVRLLPSCSVATPLITGAEPMALPSRVNVTLPVAAAGLFKRLQAVSFGPGWPRLTTNLLLQSRVPDEALVTVTVVGAETLPAMVFESAYRAVYTCAPAGVSAGSWKVAEPPTSDTVASTTSSCSRRRRWQNWRR